MFVDKNIIVRTKSKTFDIKWLLLDPDAKVFVPKMLIDYFPNYMFIIDTAFCEYNYKSLNATTFIFFQWNMLDANIKSFNLNSNVNIFIPLREMTFENSIIWALFATFLITSISL